MKEISKKEPMDCQKMKSILNLMEFNSKKLQNVFYAIENDITETIKNKIKDVLNSEISEKSRKKLLEVQENVSRIVDEKTKSIINDVRVKKAKIIFQNAKN